MIRIRLDAPDKAHSSRGAFAVLRAAQFSQDKRREFS
jgi:hypothetical protein